jgi:hypothetical protein
MRPNKCGHSLRLAFAQDVPRVKGVAAQIVTERCIA